MYKTILACINLQDKAAAEAVMAAATAHAADGGEVTAATVVPNYGLGMVRSYFPDDFVEKVMAGMAKDLEDFADAHGGAGVKRWVGHGSIHREVLRAAEELKADLIVVGAGHDDVADQVLGSQASRIVAHAPCSVLVVRS